MDSKYLISSESGRRFYQQTADLPIIDYHCHLSPKEILQDKQFDNIGQMWLCGDHYKWRLMRAHGVKEKYITGDASWRDKFVRYIEAVSFAAGNPLYHWTQMELYIYFGIKDRICAENAELIWERANAYIAENKLSPRKLISLSKVEYIATTDDMTDTLKFHEEIRLDKDFKTVVAPSFRTDNALLIKREGYPEYIDKLSDISGIEISNISDFCAAIVKRLDFFVAQGCKFTDIGIEYFPDRIYTKEQADDVFRLALAGAEISDSDYLGFLGFMYVFLAKEYSKRSLVMQWHLAVRRNANTKMYQEIGADCGGDCIGDAISGSDIIRILDRVNSESKLPKTILYTLNAAMYPVLSTIAGSFRDVVCGAAWWFCDHKRGIAEQILNISESGHIGTFLGMLTDSRSFLSYARHDYFRRILCDIIGRFVDTGEYPDEENALTLIKKISYENIKTLVKGEKI